ncbi:MAG: peptide-binding protein [Candidatus Muiribacteriota bacterium]
MNKKNIKILFLVLFLFLTSACFEDSSEEDTDVGQSRREAEIVPQKGGFLVQALTRDIVTLNPLLINDVSSGEVSDRIYEGLVEYNKEQELEGVLIKSWEIVNNGLDIIFHLKRNVKWHDGAKFTCADVKFTYEAIMSFKENGHESQVSQLYSDFDYIRSLNVLDDFTFKVSYKEPFARTIDIWRAKIIPEHIWKDELNSEFFLKASENMKPVGTGKYKLNTYIPDERIILEVNKEYHSKEAFIQQIIYTIVPDQSIVYLDTRLERIDRAKLTPTQFTSFLQSADELEKIKPVKYNGNHYMYLGYNYNNPLFKNKEVRQALTRAINRKELVNGVLEGYGIISNGPFLPHSWAYNQDVEFFEYNPEKARETLKNNGWEDKNGDGLLQKNGKNFEFDVVISRGQPVRNMALKFIQRNLKDIGIKVNIKQVAWNVLIEEYLYERDFDAVLVGWKLEVDPDIYNIWHTEGELNFINYSNERVDYLLDKARKTFDRDIRRECYHEVHSIIVEENPYTFLYIDVVLEAINRKINGVEAHESGLNDISEWFINYRTLIN